MNNKTYLAFGLALTLVLSGCKATVDLSDESDTSASLPNNSGNNGGNTEPPAPEPGNPFPEPNSDKYDPPKNELGFYDYARDGNKRNFVNHLNGDFSATIQFGQNLTVSPNGNEANWHSRLVSEREALLIVIPTANMGEINTLSAQVTVNGASKGTLQLKAPSEQPRADRTLQDSRPDVVFSKHAWTATLPWDWVVAGLELTLADDKNRTGLLAAKDIDFAASGQLVINQIQLGFLTKNPGPQYMLTNPAEAASDYFQTIPAAQMLVGSYDPMDLDAVMVDSGVIYRSPDHSVTNGDVYSGDMRENVGKATFSTGINLANWGITSARLGSQEQPQLTQRAVLHHARGKYANGEANHGLSGGNGILTLINSAGNEFSHEIGHHYGMGHYPGGNIDTPHTSFWDRHHADSGWGFIGYRNRMHSNIHWNATPATDLANFQGIYAYGTDPMAGGNQSSSLSRYTLYTGYSTYLKSQPAFDKVQYSCDFNTNTVTGTGFIKWNKDTQSMEQIQPKVPNSGNVWYNNGDGQGNYLKPRLCSVPVFTLLGGYIPSKGTALMYPAARSNLGNVFDLPAPTISTSERRCWVNVKFASKSEQNIAIAPNEMSQGYANRFNINLAQADKPTEAAVYCQEPNAQPTKLGNSISIADSASLPAMAPAVIVGKEHGYQRLWEQEKGEFTAMLEALANNPVPLLSSRGQLLYASWANRYRDDLSFAQKAQLERYETLQANMLRLNRWMFAWQQELDGSNAEAEAALLTLITDLNLAGEQTDLLPVPSAMTVGHASCLSMDTETQKLTAYGSNEPQCKDAEWAAQRSWVVDALGRIHSGADLTLCINGTSPISVGTCDLASDGQVWDFSTLPNIRKLGTNSCMNMSGGVLYGNGSKDIILYGCGSGQNEKWANVEIVKENSLLPLLHPQNLAIIQRLSVQ